MMERQEMQAVLSRSAELDRAIRPLLHLQIPPLLHRQHCSRILAAVAHEHAESVRMLIANGNATSALGVLRMQFESLVKAVWTFYAASDAIIERLDTELSSVSSKWADHLPALGVMLEHLEHKGPKIMAQSLRLFKELSWRPLSAFVHGGIHAVSRSSQGYPPSLLEQALRFSNGLLVMTAHLMVALHGHVGPEDIRLTLIHRTFADCLPPHGGLAVV